MNRLALLLALFAAALAGCRQSAQVPDARIGIDLHAEALSVGATELVVTLTDPAGAPAEAQRVAVRGDMNHAGMVPVLAEATAGQGGVYRMPFEWTMGGDWIVTVTVTLPDGATAERRFDLTVSGS